jgi:exosome complex component CSL4
MDSSSVLTVRVGQKVTPGDKIGKANPLIAGPGTYIRGSSIYSSVVGFVQVSNPVCEGSGKEVSIKLEGDRTYASSQVLSIGYKVLCKVLRITNQMTTVVIVAAEDIGALREHHEGMIRKEDVRVAATEEVEIYDSFHPGDILVARIISLGSSRRGYFLSTAENELGVIQAICSTSGEKMTPVSYKEMECPKSHIRERRKCAKPME